MLFTLLRMFVVTELKAAIKITIKQVGRLLLAGMINAEQEEDKQEGRPVTGIDKLIQRVMIEVTEEVFAPVMRGLRAKNNIEKMCMDLAIKLIQYSGINEVDILEEAEEDAEEAVDPEEIIREAVYEFIYGLDTDSVTKNFWNNKPLMD